jgi:GAF domain-containing protein
MTILAVDQGIMEISISIWKNPSTIIITSEHSNSEVARLQQVERELKARLRQQAAIADMGQQALASTDLDMLMQEIVRMTAQTLEVELCKVLELQPGGKKLLLKAGVGWKNGIAGKAMVSAGVESQAGFTLLTDEPVIVEDLGSETRFHGPDLLFDHGVVSGMSVIIHGKTEPYGVLGVHTRRSRSFNADDTNFLKGVSNILASMIERTQTEAQLNSSRDQLAIILQEVSDSVTVQNKDGRLVYVNQVAACRC